MLVSAASKLQRTPDDTESVTEPKPMERKVKRVRKKRYRHEDDSISGKSEKRVRSNQPKVNKSESISKDKKWDASTFQVEKVKDKIRFHDLGLDDEVLHAIADLNFEYCSPIQAAVLPETLKGRDCSGQAQTGTGKTIAFLISVFIQLLSCSGNKNRKNGSPRALVLAPTRELAIQVEEEALLLAKYCDLNIMSVIGGIDYHLQQKRLKNELIDIVIATPGRLLDFRRNRVIYLRCVEILVIDEADRMLDMGFIPDVTKIVYYLPSRESRQTLMFSATMVPEIDRYVDRWTKNAYVAEINPENIVSESVNQNVYIVTTEQKYVLLYNLLKNDNSESVIIFSNTRDETQMLNRTLNKHGFNCSLLTGAVAQKKRIQTLENFKNKKVRILVATDVAGRGLHVENVNLVINYNLPNDPEDYVHRIGRTGRAGLLGKSISFACEDESFNIPQIESFLGHDLKCIQPGEELLKSIEDKSPA